jgi:hypothetical protein
MPKVPEYNIPQPDPPKNTIVRCGPPLSTRKRDALDKSIDRVVRRIKRGKHVPPASR